MSSRGSDLETSPAGQRPAQRRALTVGIEPGAERSSRSGGAAPRPESHSQVSVTVFLERPAPKSRRVGALDVGSVQAGVLVLGRKPDRELGPRFDPRLENRFRSEPGQPGVR